MMGIYSEKQGFAKLSRIGSYFRSLIIGSAIAYSGAVSAAVAYPGDILIADAQNRTTILGAVYNLNTTTNGLSLLASSPTIHQPEGVALDGSGNAYVVGFGGTNATDYGSIIQINLNTGAVSTLVQGGMGVYRSGGGMIYDPAGFLVVAQQGNSTIRGALVKVSLTDGSSTLIGQQSGSVPNGVVITPDGNYFVSSFQGSPFYRVNRNTGVFTAVSVTGFTTPTYHISQDPFNPYSIIASSPTGIYSVNTQTLASTLLVSGGYLTSTPSSSEIEDSNGNIYFTTSTGNIVQYDHTLGTQTIVAALNRPVNLVFVPEPSSTLVLGGLVCILATRRRRTSMAG